MNNYRVEVNLFGNAYNVEKRVGNGWVPVIRWLNEETARAWLERLSRPRER